MPVLLELAQQPQHPGVKFIAQQRIYLCGRKVLAFSEKRRDFDRLSDPDLGIPDLVEEILVVDSDGYNIDRLPELLAGMESDPEYSFLNRHHASLGSVGTFAVDRERDLVGKAFHDFFYGREILCDLLESVPLPRQRQDPEPSQDLRGSLFLEYACPRSKGDRTLVQQQHHHSVHQGRGVVRSQQDASILRDIPDPFYIQ